VISVENRWVVWGVLSNDRRYGVFWIGSFSSYLARWFLTLVVSVVVYDLTSSSFAVGAVGVAQFLPALLLAPWAGRLSDALDRRWIVAVTNVAVALSVLVLALCSYADRLGFTVLLVVMSVIGSLNAFNAPATLAMALQLVEPDRRDTALALNGMQFNLARAVGPMVGALVIAQLGVASSLLVNVLLTSVFVLMLPALRPLPVERTTEGGARMRVALGYLRRSSHGWALVVVGATISGASDVITTIAPALSADLTGDSSDAGLFVASFGAGAAFFGLAIHPWVRHLRRQVSATMLVQAAGMALIAGAPTIHVACAGAAVSGAGFLGASVRASTMLNVSVPPDLVGRILTVWIVAVLGVRPVSALVTGGVADALSVRWAAGAAAVVLVAASMAFALRLHRLDRLVREQADVPDSGARTPLRDDVDPSPR
jgi:MFS family permease